MLNIVRKFIDLFKTNDPIDELDQTNEYIILAKSIDWEFLEKQLAGYYSQTMGAIALPIRLMAGLLILKYKDKLSDENVCKRWKTDYYYQAFTGSKKIKDKLPCDPSMLTRFRQRIGEDGANIIFQASVNIFGQKIKNTKEVELIIDSTVQEKYTAFPTDIKLAIDVIESIWTICDDYGIKLRSKHKREVYKLRKNAAFNKSNNRNKVKSEILIVLRSIGLKLLKEMSKKLPENITNGDDFQNLHNNYYKALSQQKDDHNKIYSIYEPQICCISKGKAHKKYEFGTKVGLVTDKSGILLAIKSFDTNLHDSKTIQDLLVDLESNFSIKPSILIGDAGYRGRKYYGDTTVCTPIKNLDLLPKNEYKLHINRMNNRSTIEQVISHLKNDFLLGRNELRGKLGDKINPIFSAIAHNFSLYVRLEQKKIKDALKSNNKIKKRRKSRKLFMAA